MFGVALLAAAALVLAVAFYLFRQAAQIRREAQSTINAERAAMATEREQHAGEREKLLDRIANGGMSLPPSRRIDGLESKDDGGYGQLDVVKEADQLVN